jgi:hypothetical protein
MVITVVITTVGQQRRCGAGSTTCLMLPDGTGIVPMTAATTLRDQASSARTRRSERFPLGRSTV